MKKKSWLKIWRTPAPGAAGIYASLRFGGVFVGKVCLNLNFITRYSSLFTKVFLLAKQSITQNFGFRKKFIKNEK